MECYRVQNYTPRPKPDLHLDPGSFGARHIHHSGLAD